MTPGTIFKKKKNCTVLSRNSVDFSTSGYAQQRERVGTKSLCCDVCTRYCQNTQVARPINQKGKQVVAVQVGVGYRSARIAMLRVFAAVAAAVGVSVGQVVNDGTAGAVSGKQLRRGVFHHHGPPIFDRHIELALASPACTHERQSPQHLSPALSCVWACRSGIRCVKPWRVSEPMQVCGCGSRWGRCDVLVPLVCVCVWWWPEQP